MIDIDKKIDELVNNHSKLDLAQMVVERDSSIDILNGFINKLKCCENCKYHSYCGDELKCNYGLKEALQEDKLIECHNLEKWKMIDY